MKQSITSKMLAAMFRIRADCIEYKGTKSLDRTDEPTPEELTYDVLYREYKELELLFTILADQIERKAHR